MVVGVKIVGAKKWSMAHSSTKLFWRGVPLRISLICAPMPCKACETAAS